jgi:hypothetical protein
MFQGAQGSFLVTHACFNLDFGISIFAGVLKILLQRLIPAFRLAGGL